MDYVALMKEMLADAERAPRIFSPGPYWKPHADLMIGLVRRHGIENFRAIPDKALTAFATGNKFNPPANRALKLNDALRRLPVIGRFPDAIARLIEGSYRRARSETNNKLHVVFALLQQIAPDLTELKESGVGNPPVFSIYGRAYSEMFLLKLLEIALLRQHVDFEKIKNVVEIGGSYGLVGEILRKRYPAIRYMLVDLAPVAAFAQFYLECLSRRGFRLRREGRCADPHSLRAPNARDRRAFRSFHQYRVIPGNECRTGAHVLGFRTHSLQHRLSR